MAKAPLPKDLLRFIQFDAFPAAWRRMELDDEDLRELELIILQRPGAAPVIVGTGGLRKVRFSPSRWGRGKSGSIRVYYSHYPAHGLVALLFAHDKHGMDTISAEKKKQIKVVLDEIAVHLARHRREFI